MARAKTTRTPSAAARSRVTRAGSRKTTAGRGSPAQRRPRFEAIVLVVETAPSQAPAEVVARLVDEAGLRGWTVRPTPGAADEFALLPPARRRVSPSAAWKISYQLRDRAEVVHAEPLFAYAVPDVHEPPARTARTEEHDPATADDCEWSLRTANVLAAWDLFGTRLPGAGVTVGHPDTGYTPHPELAEPSRLLVDKGFDFDDDDADALDDLAAGFMDNPGHGTGTGSVIVSARGALTAPGLPAFVSGVAPHASLIPIRTTESVVLFSMHGLRCAIDHAVAQGCQVISISLGGPLPSLSLRRAIRRATDAGTIVLAAAGNFVRVVVFPAAFDDAVAVAGSTIQDEPWNGSCRGDAVDITAPGASVWRARVERGPDGGFTFSVLRGSGTSFAVATVAGVAALWVSYHGWPELVRRYGAPGVARVFKHLLQATCRTPPGWDSASFGPGIVDARALLEAPLPETALARKARDARRAAVASDVSGLEAILHLMPDVPRTGLELALADLLRVSDRDLPAVLQDVGEELAFQLVMQPDLRERVEARARSAGATVTLRRSQVTPPLEPGLVSRRLAGYLKPAARRSGR